MGSLLIGIHTPSNERHVGVYSTRPFTGQAADTQGLHCTENTAVFNGSPQAEMLLFFL